MCDFISRLKIRVRFKDLGYTATKDEQTVIFYKDGSCPEIAGIN